MKPFARDSQQKKQNETNGLNLFAFCVSSLTSWIGCQSYKNSQYCKITEKNTVILLAWLFSEKINTYYAGIQTYQIIITEKICKFVASGPGLVLFYKSVD